MKGFVLVDILLGVLIFSITCSFAFSSLEQYERLNFKAFEYDLAKRTAVNILVRQFVEHTICKNMNGFEIIEDENCLVFSKNGEVFVLRTGR